MHYHYKTKVAQGKFFEFWWSVLSHPPKHQISIPQKKNFFLNGKSFKSQEVKPAVDNFFQSKSVKFNKEMIEKLSGKLEKAIESSDEYIIK